MIRSILGTICALGLIAMFLFQKTSWMELVGFNISGAQAYLANTMFRYFINDILAIGLIFALFGKRNYIVFAIYVQMFGLVFLLIPYLALRIYLANVNGALISFLHRITLNPTLLLILIPAFYYQEKSVNDKNK